MFRPRFVPATLAAFILSGPIASAIVFTYSGATDGNYQNGANWGGTAPGFNATVGETRFNINSATQPLLYTAAEGFTTLDVGQITSGSSPANETRAIVIAAGSNSANGALSVTGGTLRVIQEGTTAAVLVGAGADLNFAGQASLTVSAGTLNVSGGEIGVLSRGAASATATLTISGSGAVVADIVSFGNLNTSIGTGIINLDGGSLRTRVVFDRFAVANSILNFNGGTLISNDNNNDEEWVRDDNGGILANVLAGGAFFDTNGQNGQRINVVLNGSAGGNVTKLGAGTLVLEQDNAYDGATIVNEGTLQLGNNTATGTIGSGALTLAPGATLAIARSDALLQSTFTGAGVTSGLAGDVNFAIGGSGIFTADIANAHTGSTTVRNNGFLRVIHAGALGPTSVGTVVLGSGADTSSDANGGSLMLDGGITITGEALTIRGSGGTPGAGLIAQRGALQSVSGENTWAGDITIAGTNTRIGVQDGASLNLPGTISDGGAGHNLIFRGGTNVPGQITLSGTGNQWGQTIVFGSVVRIAGGNDILPVAAPLLVGTSGVGASILDLNGRNQRIAGLSQVAAFSGGIVTNHGGTPSTLTIDNSLDFTFDGTISQGGGEPLSLVKEGSGTQTLAGLSDYSGTTSIHHGALLVDGSISGSMLTVGPNGLLGGSGTISSSVAEIFGNVDPGAGIGRLTIDSPTTFAAGSKLSITAAGAFSAGFDYDQLTIGNLGSLTIAGGEISLALTYAPTLLDEITVIDLAGSGVITGTFSNLLQGGLLAATFGGTPYFFEANYFGGDGNDLTLVNVPEPASALGFALGLGVLIARRRGRRS